MLLTTSEVATLRALTRSGIGSHHDLATTTAIHCEYFYRSMLARAAVPILRDLAARDWPTILAALLAARSHWRAHRLAAKGKMRLGLSLHGLRHTRGVELA